MPRDPYPPDAVQQARDVAQAWKNIDPAFKVGDMALSTLQDEVAQALSVQDQISSLETQLTHLRNQRDTLNASLWDKIKRARNTVKGIYGDDSSQYEMIGGTRRSERKPPTRKPKPTPSA